MFILMLKHALVYFKFFITIIVVVLLTLIFNPKAFASELWIDNFNEVDTARWDILNETNTQILYSGEGLFSNVSLTQALFFQNNIPLPLGDISVEVKFRYFGNGFGNGIAVNDNQLSHRSLTHPGPDDWTIFIWPTNSVTFKVFSSLCPSSGTCIADNVFSTQTGAEYTNPHVVKIDYIGNRYTVYLDGVLVGETISSSRAPRYVWLGNPMTTGGVTFSSFYVDYVKISDFTTPSPSPSPIPSPTPSPSPSPIPSPVPSPIPSPIPSPSVVPSPIPSVAPSVAPSGYPYYSQLDPLWGSQIYDHAQRWAESGKRGIDRWGCALTSAAMVLKHYGVKTVSGIETTPAVLNAWLRIQSDGYLRNGLVNWLAISRYTHQSKLAGKSPTELEFSKKIFSAADVDLSLANGRSPILGLPGHFVLAHSDQVTNYGINDPNQVLNVSMPKTDPILTANTFIPSMTDLSYMLFAYDPTMEIVVKDATGSAVNGVRSEEYLNDDKGGAAGSHLKLLYIQKPRSGNYSIEISNPGNAGTIDMYMYDQNGNVKEKNLKIRSATQTAFELKYDRTKSSKCQYGDKWKWVRRYYSHLHKYLDERWGRGWDD